ncbi:MAG TPA: hypothetical protein VM489_08040 [Burkholderiales bacterium]|nr:hypothetical protein [Burkholderiales bacterium]
MDDDALSRITEWPDYVLVDFGSCNGLELSETYRCFAELCVGKHVNRALLKAGDNDPEGHRRLQDALSAMARSAAISPDFKLALVPGSPPIEAVYREAQQACRAIGLNAWIFPTIGEASDWLQGRAQADPAAS